MTKQRQVVARHSYKLKPGDELCLTCPLPDCQETSPDCPRGLRARYIKWIFSLFTFPRIVERAVRMVRR